MPLGGLHRAAARGRLGMLARRRAGLSAEADARASSLSRASSRVPICACARPAWRHARTGRLCVLTLAGCARAAPVPRACHKQRRPGPLGGAGERFPPSDRAHSSESRLTLAFRGRLRPSRHSATRRSRADGSLTAPVAALPSALACLERARVQALAQAQMPSKAGGAQQCPLQAFPPPSFPRQCGAGRCAWVRPGSPRWRACALARARGQDRA